MCGRDGRSIYYRLYWKYGGGGIEAVKDGIESIADEIAELSGGETYRLSFCIVDEKISGVAPSYYNSSDYQALLGTPQAFFNAGAGVDQYITCLQVFTDNNINDFKTQVEKINTGAFPLGDGAGGPEPTDMALGLIINNNFHGSWRSNVAKFIIILTDAPPSGDDDYFTADDELVIAAHTTTCQAQGIKVCVLGSQYEGASLWSNFAIATGGGTSPDYAGSSIIGLLQEGCD